jgi:hypothetical protein
MTSSRILQVNSCAPPQDPGPPPPVDPARDAISALIESIAPECGDNLSYLKVSEATGASLEALHRARLTGNVAKDPDGQRIRVKLKSVKLFGRFYVSRQDLEVYLRRLNGEDCGGQSPESPGPRTPTQRQRESARAAEEAASLGC